MEVDVSFVKVRGGRRAIFCDPGTKVRGHRGLVVKASDFRAEGRGFESCSGQAT